MSPFRQIRRPIRRAERRIHDPARPAPLVPVNHRDHRAIVVDGNRFQYGGTIRRRASVEEAGSATGMARGRAVRITASPPQREIYAHAAVAEPAPSSGGDSPTKRLCRDTVPAVRSIWLCLWLRGGRAGKPQGGSVGIKPAGAAGIPDSSSSGRLSPIM